jgi:hypothetical protein
MRITKIGQVAAFVILSLIMGCTSIQEDWKVARSADTIAAYEDFLCKHPQGELAEQVRSRVEATQADSSEWEKALKMNTIRGYADFIEQHPHSPFADKAKGKIVDIEVSDILRRPHGQLPSANRISGGGGRTYSVVNIHNDTRYNLTIRYSGPESFKVVFSPNEKGSIEVLRGSYKVAASVDATNVKDYAGEETSDGGNYEVEYYIVTTGPFGFSPPRISPPQIYYGSAPGFECWPSKRSVPDYLK